MAQARRTKIVATLGPSTDDPAVLRAVLEAGADVVRLNLSHGQRRDHAQRVGAVKRAVDALGRHVALMLDTRGPEVRLGPVQDDGVPGEGACLQEGARLRLRCASPESLSEGGAAEASVNHPDLWRDVVPGTRLLLDDGAIALRVASTREGVVDTQVVRGGMLRSGKKVNAPGVQLSLPAVSAADASDLRWAAEVGFDWVAASFVQHAGDVLALRRIIEESTGNMGIIAKVECRAGVANLESILEVADGLMVARGDLGVEYSVEEVPVLQKRLILAARRRGIPVITATEMLESMVRDARPTRAEASDVANAIWDGTDAVMLSAETAAGRHPAEAVRVMAHIATETEAAGDFGAYLRQAAVSDESTTTEAVTAATCQVAAAIKADAIVVPTTSGFTARMMARHRPEVPVVAVTPSRAVAQRLTLVWGVIPLASAALSVAPGDGEAGQQDFFQAALAAAERAGAVAAGQLVVVTGGVPVGIAGTTNFLQVRSLGRVLCRGVGIGHLSAQGSVRHVRAPGDLEGVGPDTIVVAVSGDVPGFAPALARAAGAVVEAAGFTSSAAIAALSVRRPLILGVPSPHDALRDGEPVTVDPVHGLVYAGRVRVAGAGSPGS